MACVTGASRIGAASRALDLIVVIDDLLGDGDSPLGSVWSFYGVYEWPV